jgi:hypothetical protein
MRSAENFQLEGEEDKEEDHRQWDCNHESTVNVKEQTAWTGFNIWNENSPTFHGEIFNILDSLNHSSDPKTVLRNYADFRDLGWPLSEEWKRMFNEATESAKEIRGKDPELFFVCNWRKRAHHGKVIVQLFLIECSVFRYVVQQTLSSAHAPLGMPVQHALKNTKTPSIVHASEFQSVSMLPSKS